MSEDPNALPDQPEEASSQPEQQPEAPQSPESQEEQASGQPAPANSEQYPPLPAFYEQMGAPDPYGAPATNYGAGQPVYGAPPLMPPPAYGVPPVGGYGTPPLMPLPGYAMRPFAPNPEYGFVPPAQPLPLGQALRDLPRQYRKILKKPDARAFAEEQGKAAWDIIWMQLLFVALLSIVSVFLTFSLETRLFASLTSSLSSLSNTTGSPAVTPVFPTFSTGFIVIEALFAAIFAPGFFLLGVLIQYWLAKLFRGNGVYKQQAYNHLLFYVPVQVISLVLNLIAVLLITLFANPFTLVLILIPTLAASGLGIYSIILNVFSIMATHRLSGGKASGVVLIPYAVFVVLYIVLIIVVFAVAFSMAAQFH